MDAEETTLDRIAFTEAHAALLSLRARLRRRAGADAQRLSTVDRAIDDALERMRAAGLATGVVQARGGKP